MAQVSEINVSELIPCRPINGAETFFSLPIFDCSSDLSDFYHNFNLSRFKNLKLKISNMSQSLSNLECLLAVFNGNIAIDANEAFESVDDVLSFFKSIDLSRILFLEQPFQANVQLGRELRKKFPVMLMADESLTSGTITEEIARDFNAVNIKLMKSGSLLKVRKQMREARSFAMKVMIGCMVETSLSIEKALLMAGLADYLDLDGMLLIKNDPFLRVVESEGRLFFNDKH